MLKLDCEGNEPLILDGADALLKRGLIKNIIAETSTGLIYYIVIVFLLIFMSFSKKPLDPPPPPLQVNEFVSDNMLRSILQSRPNIWSDLAVQTQYITRFRNIAQKMRCSGRILASRSRALLAVNLSRYGHFRAVAIGGVILYITIQVNHITLHY